LNKQTILGSLRKLVDEFLITVDALVVVLNYIHLIWQQNALNGKATPKGCFPTLRFVSHERSVKLGSLIIFKAIIFDGCR
jgi:hypothetical protein